MDSSSSTPEGNSSLNSLCAELSNAVDNHTARANAIRAWFKDHTDENERRQAAQSRGEADMTALHLVCRHNDRSAISDIALSISFGHRQRQQDGRMSLVGSHFTMPVLAIVPTTTTHNSSKPSWMPAPKATRGPIVVGALRYICIGL